MIKNRRRKAPFIIASAITVSTVALAIVGIRGIKQTEKIEYFPKSDLYSDMAESNIMYEQSDTLPLCFKLSQSPYMIDIPKASYQKTASGVYAKVEEAYYIYLAESTDLLESGMSLAMDEFPSILYEDYNRNGSFVTPKVNETGYMCGYTTDYSFNVATLGHGSEQTKVYMVSYELQAEGSKVVVAGLTTGKADGAKDYIKEITLSCLKTIRENPDFEYPTETDSTASEQPKPSVDYTVGSIEIEALEVAESKPAKQPETKPQDKPQESKPQESKPQESQQQQTQPESKPQESQPQSQPESKPQESQQPTPTPTPQPSTPPTPTYDQNDKSVKTFTCPMTDCAMSVTVTTGSFCPDTVVTLTCPDGSSLVGASNGAGTYTFQTVAESGTYTVTTTCFSAVGTVNINAHFY